MTNITFYKRDKAYIGFEISGHSGYADKGSDIVCAAISAVTEYMLEYLQTYCIKLVNFSVEDQSTYICVMANKPDTDVSNHIYIMHSTFIQLLSQYDKFINIQVKEV